jgi:hypothetical protein
MGIIKNWKLFSNAISVFEIRLFPIGLAFIIVIEIKGGRYVFYHGNYGWQERF